MESIRHFKMLLPWLAQSVIVSRVCEQMAQRIAEWRPGVYVRVYGNVSDFDDKWRIQAYNIRTITDFNEVCPLLGRFMRMTRLWPQQTLSEGSCTRCR